MKQNFAIDKVSFEVESGHIVDLIVPSGAGTSTMMRAITDLMSYSSSTVSFDGRPITFSNHQTLTKLT
ncbi:ATP-binding cassette domain-containing protein [Leuconostoc sp. JNUCC 76]